MWVVAGLGNPGPAYAGNRHNIGFLAVDRAAELHPFTPFNQKFQGMLTAGRIGEERAMLFKPLTFMNLSGQALGELMRYYQVPVENLIVLHDELDLPLGRMRVKQGGSSGGHNGLKSIDAHVGVEYWRVRLGIGHPGDKDEVSHYVLSDFTPEEKPITEKLVDAAAAHLPLLIAGDEAEYMNRVALAMKPPKKQPAA